MVEPFGFSRAARMPALDRAGRSWLGRIAATVIALTAPAYALAGDGVAGEWHGTYVCAQGPTELTLRIAPDAGNQVSAFFHFFAGADNPLVPEGCFEMTGVYDTQTRHVDLAAGKWILQPDGFVTVDLSGTISRDGAHLTGSVIGPGCTEFSVQRVVSPSRQLPHACLVGGVVA